MMIGQTLEVQLLNICGASIAFAVNWLLQSTLLISVGLLTAWLFRNRGSAFQSVVYRTTLFAVLLGPFVSLGMGLVGFEGWSMKLPPTFAFNQTEQGIAPTALHVDANQVANNLNRGQGVQLANPLTVSPQFGSLERKATGIDPIESSTTSIKEERTGVALEANSSLSTAQGGNDGILSSSMNSKPDTPSLEIRRFGIMAIALSILWGVIGGERIIRLIVGMVEMHRLRSRSIAASLEEVTTCQRIANELKLNAPLVLRTPFLTSPCLHGIRQPAVMLPEEVEVPLQEIFVHELAHLRRHDCFWLLLHQIVSRVFFFQPLLYWLGRRIDATAEEVCDDFVVQFGGSRESYATSLVDLASLSTPSIAFAGVGMVTMRSLLGQRVGRIMDTSRSLTTRVGNLPLLIVISGGLAAILICGFIGLSSSSSATAQDPTKSEIGSTTVVKEVKQQSPKPNVSTLKVIESSTETITGRITGHDGKAVAGAKLLWYRTRVHDIDPMLPKLLAESDNKGDFSFTPPAVPDPEKEFGSWAFHERIAIVAPGHGFKITMPRALKEAKPTSLFGAIASSLNVANESPSRLPAEGKPLHGRIVSIEGTPVAGAKLSIRNFLARTSPRYQQVPTGNNESKDAEWSSWVFNLLNVIEPASERFALPMATTDEDGRFELTSLPDDCLFQLLLEGEGIQSTDIVAHNVAGENKVVVMRNQPDQTSTTIYHDDFLFVAAPSRPVIGQVTDLDTGLPIPNAVVRAFMVHGEPISSSREREHFATRTDKDGRYRITGLPLGNGNRLAAFTTGDLPYFPVGQQIDTSKSDSRVEANFSLKKTLWATGRVVDGDTGKPFTGEMTYYWFRDRSLEAAMPGLRETNTDGLFYTNSQGEFRVPVLPTRGILAYRWDGDGFQQPNPIERFPRGLGAEKIDGKEVNMDAYPTMPYYLMAGNYNFVSEVTPKSADEQVEVEMVLQSSKPVEVKLVVEDSEKLPTGNYQIYGLNERWGWQTKQTTELVVEDLLPNHSRKVFAFHRESGLAGGVLVDENSKQPVEIKLIKSGSLKGRLVDQSGDPITDGTVSVDYQKLWGNEPYAIWADPANPYTGSRAILVDSEGRFELNGIIPGWKYTANVSAPRKMQEQMISMIIGQAFTDMEIKPGEVRDLGDIVVGSPEDKEDKSELKSSSSNTTKPPANSNAPTFTGSIHGSDNKPIADATVTIVGWTMNTRDPKAEVVAQAKTSNDGKFLIELNGASSKTHGQPVLFVRKDGFGIAWHKVNFDVPGKTEPIKLIEEGVITGRLVDIEGQPLAGLEIQPTIVVIPKHGRSFEDSEGIGHDKTFSTTTDSTGRFTIRGISKGQGVYLQIQGNDKIAPQSVALNTGAPEQRGEYDGTYRDIVRNLKPDEDAIITLAPAQIFEGVVQYADTKESVSNANVTIWSSQEKFGSMIQATGKTNQKGQYRISANPGTHFRIQVQALSNTPYLNRDTPSDKPIEWKTGDRFREFDVELLRGVLVRGTVTEKDSKTPIADAYIQYVPESSNNKNESDDILTGWQAMERSDKDGNFTMAVLPGPGRILVSTPGQNHILKPIGSRSIDENKDGGVRNYVHAFERIDPTVNSDSLNLQISVERGKRISGNILNNKGEAPKQVTVVSILNISPFSLFWRGHSEPVLNGRFELGALAEGVEYKTHFLDAENKLGATAILTVGSDNATIKLEPCGRATARFVDEQGQPLANHQGGDFYFVLTPGANQYDMNAMKSGQWAGDADFAGNVDRQNHPIDNVTDADGRITYTSLIPGATYEIRTGSDRKIAKSFVAKSGESIDLGELKIDVKE